MVFPTLFLIILFRYLTLPGAALSFMSFVPVFKPRFVYTGPEFLVGIARFFHYLNPANLFSYFSTSQWVGLRHFNALFSESNFVRALGNTLLLSGLKLAIAFPFTIALALMINEIRIRRYKRFLQTVFTFPHFLSWVVVSGIVLNLFGDTGAIKKLLLHTAPGLAENWNVLYNPATFRWNMVLLDIWKESGWGTILYLGAIAGIDPTLYEAAAIDGCGRVRSCRYVTLPGITGVIVIMFLLSVGNLVNANFDQVFNLYSPQTYATGDVIDTYIYRMSFQSLNVSDFGFTTAVGLFKSVVNFSMLIAANFLARRAGYRGIM
jgi:putative aldouronate transport system permease protein